LALIRTQQTSNVDPFSKEEAESAAKCIDEYTKEIHPELKKSEELAAQGKCPACGFEVGFDAKECSDCGLLLVIESD